LYSARVAKYAFGHEADRQGATDAKTQATPTSPRPEPNGGRPRPGFAAPKPEKQKFNFYFGYPSNPGLYIALEHSAMVLACRCWTKVIGMPQTT